MLYERNDRLVIEAFRRGEFDYLEGVGEVSETDFFRAIASKKVLDKLAETYPSPCQKHDVPLWVYIASDISMRFRGVHQFHAFPYVVRSGGIVNAFGPGMGHKVTHPGTGDVSLSCEGFNNKNEYDRETPCDQDYLRKMAKRTDASLLMTWFNRDVTGIFKQHHAFDPEGIFIGDATYLFVPDNERYEGSSRMLFDEHNHPIDPKDISPVERARCVWHRCYKLVSLIHTNRAGDFFLYAALEVVAGKDHESPVLYRLVEEFAGFHGKGIMKRLILDRGFLDGPAIGRCKKEWGIDVRRQDSAPWPSVRLQTSYRPNRTPMLCSVPKLLWSMVWKRSLPALCLWMPLSIERCMPMATRITGCCFPQNVSLTLPWAAWTMPCVLP